MDVKIEEFEKRVIDAVSELRNLMGARCIEVTVNIDNYESSCKTEVTFCRTYPTASNAPGCGNAC